MPDCQAGKGNGAMGQAGSSLGKQWMGNLCGVWLGPLFAVTAGSLQPRSSRKYELLKCNNSRKALALELTQYSFYSSWFPPPPLGVEPLSLGHGWEERLLVPWPCQQVTISAATLLSFPLQPGWKWRPGSPWGFWMTTFPNLFSATSSQEPMRGAGGMRKEQAFLAATFT